MAQVSIFSRQRQDPPSETPAEPAAPRPLTPMPAPTGTGGVGPEAVTWALRFLIGREPHSEAELAFHGQHATLENLRIAFAETGEFAEFAARALGRRRGFGLPLFMLRPPADAAMPWVFAPPSLDQPVTQLCTASQYAEPAYDEIAEAMRLGRHLHRRSWEQAYIVSALANHGAIAPGRRVIGFGVGRERVPALLASRGVEVTVDLPAGDAARDPAELLAKQAELAIPDIVARDVFDGLVRFEAYGMDAMRPDFAGRFDALWSCGALHRMRSLQAGLDFVAESLSALRPGGVAVHTTDFNLVSDKETVDQPGLSLLRRRDVESLAARLRAEGHDAAPVNLHPGLADEDSLIDGPPYGLPHLKVAAGAFIVTSLGIIVRKAG